MLSLFVAGHETIAITIANTLYYLAKYPVYQKLVQQEARLFYERRGDSITGISLSDLEKELPVLHRVILEVWRLMPPGSVTISRAVASDDANFNGVKIPRGTVVFVSIYDVHRCEKTWGPDAAEFIPERFCIDRKLENELNEMPEKLLTFGYGPHSCLGTLFGTVEGFVGVSKLASKFWFEIPDGSPDSVRIITKKMFAIMSPANLQLKISKVD